MQIKKFFLSDEKNSELDGTIDQVLKTYQKDYPLNHINTYPIPSKEKIVSILEDLFDVIYPGYFTEREINNANISRYYGNKLTIIFEKLSMEIAKSFRHEHLIDNKECEVCDQCIERGINAALHLLKKLPHIRELLAEDLQSAFDGDPAAKNFHEIVFSYPGFFAITVHRIAHLLYNKEVPLIPRVMSEHSHSLTGIDIHPGATIGRHFFIDHGTGVVIGETCKIGKNVKIYQGVTLGALSFPKDERGIIIKGLQRHPIIEDNVTIYSNATILGGETVIGKNAIIGGNTWIISSIPEDSKVTVADSDTRIKIKKK